MSRPHHLFGDPSLREVGVAATTLWRAADSPRGVDGPAVRDEPDVAAWADGMDADVRLGLHGRTDSQLVLGEPAQVLEERDGWSRVAALWQATSRHDGGYRGWVPSAHLSTPVPLRRGASATVVTRTATCRIDGREVPVSFGTALWLAGTGEESATVHLPGDRTGEIDLGHLRLGHKDQPPVYGADDVLAAARRFLGVRYLWGGTSGWGVDCSGLVHLVLRSFGVLLPRDAHDQADCPQVEAVRLDAVQPGDLYFFARPGEPVYHVGFVTGPVGVDGSRPMLHAPEGAELVEDCPMAPQRVEHLVSAGRVVRPSP